MTREEVAIAIISYNTREILRACLETVVKDRPREIVVVDNGSSDGSVQMIQERFPGVRVEVDASNPGYGAAANRAVAACSAPYILLLNSDTLVPPGAIDALVEYANGNPRAGMVGPRLLNVDGSLQPSCFAFPSIGFLLVEYTTLRVLAARVAHWRERFFIGWLHDTPRVIPWTCGAALLIRRTAFDEVRGFDPTFYMYYEEVDLAYRMAAAGWESHFAPVGEIVHIGGASTANVWSQMRVRHFRSMMQFAARHLTTTHATALALLLTALMRAKLILDRSRRLLMRDSASRLALDARIAHWRELAGVPFLREMRGFRHAITNR